MASPVLLSETGAERARQAIGEGAENATWKLMCFIRRNLKVGLRARRGRKRGGEAGAKGAIMVKERRLEEREWDRGEGRSVGRLCEGP